MTRAVQIAELGDQSVFTIDSSNNRVGIGSTQPTNKLDVNDGAITVGTGITIDSVSDIVVEQMLLLRHRRQNLLVPWRGQLLVTFQELLVV